MSQRKLQRGRKSKPSTATTAATSSSSSYISSIQSDDNQLDENQYQHLHSIIRRITSHHSTSNQIIESQLLPLLSTLKGNKQQIQQCSNILFQRLKINHTLVRSLTLHVIHQIFIRSSVFRYYVSSRLNELFEYTLGISDSHSQHDSSRHRPSDGTSSSSSAVDYHNEVREYCKQYLEYWYQHYS